MTDPSVGPVWAYVSGVILLLVAVVILALVPLLLYCWWRKRKSTYKTCCKSSSVKVSDTSFYNNNVYCWSLLILSLSQVIIVGKESMYSQFYVLTSWLLYCDYDSSEMMMIEKPETDQVGMWHLHVRCCVWPVCCSMQSSVSVQPISDLRSKLPEYMTPADARKEAEVIKQQVKYVFCECTNIHHKHVNILWPQKYTFHVIHIPHCIIHVCIAVRIHIVHWTGHLAYYSGLIQCSSHFKSIDTFFLLFCLLLIS